MDGSADFRVMLLSISNELDQETLDSLKFLCKDVGKKKLEQISKGIELFQCLIEKGKIGPDDTEFLRTLLTNVGKTLLINHIHNYERGLNLKAEVLDPKDQEKINIATDVIVEHVGRDWKKLGRKLGLNDTKLDSIQDKQSCDLEEKVRELIKEWMKIQRENAKVETLIKALRDCKQNYTADLVEKNLQEL